MKKKPLPRGERLKKNNDISRVFDQGTPFKGRLVSVFMGRGAKVHTNRAAFVIKKSLYNKKLVLRNRFRRIIREAYRNSKFLLLPGHDIVILANRVDKNTKSTAVEQELKYVFKKYIESNNKIIS
ncbi:MAG: ribonuclease P protein component [Candidatus Omnitrophota bacterium]